jgi:hypothetical protein
MHQLPVPSSIFQGLAKHKHLPAIKHEIMEKRGVQALFIQDICKKNHVVTYKTNPKKITEKKSILYLFRSVGQHILPNSISVITFFFLVQFE